jgi:hypothetical protein
MSFQRDRPAGRSPDTVDLSFVDDDGAEVTYRFTASCGGGLVAVSGAREFNARYRQVPFQPCPCGRRSWLRRRSPRSGNHCLLARTSTPSSPRSVASCLSAACLAHGHTRDRHADILFRQERGLPSRSVWRWREHTDLIMTTVP